MRISSNDFLKYFLIVFYLIYFIFGVLAYKDYGITTDEEFQRYSGFYWLSYVLNFTPFESLYYLVEKKLVSISGFTLPNPADFPFYGVVFDMPLALIEVLLGMENSKDYFFLRHLFNFIIFYISSIFIYFLLRSRFEKNYISILGVLFYVGSPRIFGDSFFNNKDIIFLSLVTIALYYCFKLLNKFNFKNIFLFALFSAIATGSRVLGIFLPISVISIIFFDMLDKKLNLNQFLKVILIIVLYSAFTIILWPYLWESPVTNFLKALSLFSNYIIDIKFLFNGNYISSTSLPYTYIPLWLFISTPFITIIFFIIGYSLNSKKFFLRLINIDKNRNNSLWNNNNEKKDFLIFFNFTLILVYLIFSNTVLYNGWRQIYFLNIFLIYFVAYGMNYLFYNNEKLKKINKWLYTLTIIFLVNIYYEIYKIHPYQSFYFNKFFTKNVHDKFEIDYWGLSGREFIHEVLKLEKNNEVYIGVASWVPLERSLALFGEKEKKRIFIVGQNYNKAKYIFSNNITEVDTNKNDKYKIPDNFKKIDEFKLDDLVIYTIYKNNDF